MTTDLANSRTRSLWMVALASILLLSLFLLMDHMSLIRLKHEVRTHTHDAQVASLQDKLADLQEQFEEVKRRPAAVTQSAFAAARSALEDRLSQIEQSTSGNARMDDVMALQNRLTTLETRLAKVSRPKVASAPATTAPSTPIVLEPPFSILGIELRGGERVLALLPAGSHTLAEARLLRVGDTQDRWQLEALSAKTAQFRVDGRLQRIDVP